MLLVFSGHGPIVFPHVPIGGAERDHGFNRENHSWLNQRVVLRLVIVRDDQTGMKAWSNTVTGELFYDPVVESFGVGLNGPANDVYPSTRQRCVDSSHHGLFGSDH